LKLEDFIGLEIMTADAMVIGDVEGVGVDVKTWKVPALKVGLKKGLEEPLGIKKPRFGSTTIYVKSEGVESISDMITLNRELEKVPEILMQSEKELPTAGSIVNTRVIAKGGRHLGYVDNFIFAPEKEWAITSMVVKLEKAVLNDLGMKKPPLGTPSIKILSEDIKTIGDMVMLNIDIGELRDHLEKKPRKRTIEESEEKPPERGTSSGDQLPFQVNRDFDSDEAEKRARKLDNL